MRGLGALACFCALLAGPWAPAFSGEVPDYPPPAPLFLETEASESSAAWERTLAGGFRLEKRTYCVGEPIFAVFEVTNDGELPFTFAAYSVRANRAAQFIVSIRNAAGKRLKPPPLGLCGGRGYRRTIKPRGGEYVEYFLLSRWAHLLPPGEYVARAARKLRLGWDSEEGPTFRGTVSFTVEPYDYEKIKSSVLDLLPKRQRGPRGTRFGRPIYRALHDVAATFDMPVNVYGWKRDEELVRKVASLLPEAWDDRCYLEPNLVWNRNWVTVSRPEEYTLTFSVRNNSNEALPSGIAGSRLYVDGEEVEAWDGMLKRIAEKKRFDRLDPGRTIEFALSFNDYLEEDGPNRFEWHVNGRVLQSDSVRFVRGALH